MESRDGAAQEVEKLILSTLEKLGLDGFADDAIAAAVNTVEFRMREYLPARYPKGLHMILEMASEANFDRVGGVASSRRALNIQQCDLHLGEYRVIGTAKVVNKNGCPTRCFLPPIV